MKKMKLVGASVLCALMLVGCGATQKVDLVQGKGGPVSPANRPITFFAHTSSADAKLTLSPDPWIEQQFPSVTPPKTPVIVYVPVYPGATPAKPVTTIGDMGTPLDADLVVGTLYFQSTSSQTQIKQWYTQQFQGLGYTMGGQGQGDKFGNPITDYFSFTKNSPPGNPTQTPDIDLGFLMQRQNGKTVFKLKAYYIVVPPRPKNSYLPTDIVKVVLTDGKVKKTITDKKWIENVVQAMNRLQVATPGRGSGAAVTPGTITTVTARFYSHQGSIINARFSLLAATVQLGTSDVQLNTGTSPTLEKNIESILGI